MRRLSGQLAPARRHRVVPAISAGCRTDWPCRAGTEYPGASRPLVFGRRASSALIAPAGPARREWWAKLATHHHRGCDGRRFRLSGVALSHHGAQLSAAWLSFKGAVLPITLYDSNLFNPVILLL